MRHEPPHRAASLPMAAGLVAHPAACIMRQTKSYAQGCAVRGSIVGLVRDDEDDPDDDVQHIARHGITPREVRQALRGALVFIASDEVDGPNPVYVAVGPTASGKLLEVWGIHFQSPPMQGF